MGGLTEDPAFLATTFVVIDFEATTPGLPGPAHRGRRSRTPLRGRRVDGGRQERISHPAARVRPGDASRYGPNRLDPRAGQAGP